MAGNRLPASSTDQATDLAVIQAEGVSGQKAATFSDSDTLAVGEVVLAVGNSLGLEGTATALGRLIGLAASDLLLLIG